MSKIIIPGRLPGMNEYTSACRTHKAAGARMKRENQWYVQLMIRQQRQNIAAIKPPVTLSYSFFEPNMRRDKDNVESFAKKVIQDALVAEGILPNDGWAEVSGSTVAFDKDKDNPRIEVEILEAKV